MISQQDTPSVFLTAPAMSSAWRWFWPRGKTHQELWENMEKSWKHHGKSPCFRGKSTISIAFYGHVQSLFRCLPERVIGIFSWSMGYFLYKWDAHALSLWIFFLQNLVYIPVCSINLGRISEELTNLKISATLRWCPRILTVTTIYSDNIMEIPLHAIKQSNNNSYLIVYIA